jgi:hypothetical protein
MAIVNGTPGPDTLTSSGNDRLDAGAGSDRLRPALGADHVLGGSGSDTLVIEWSSIKVDTVLEASGSLATGYDGRMSFVDDSGTLPGAAWVREAEHSAFGVRDVASPLTYNGYHWLSNGFVASDQPAVRDLYRSHDGITWELVNAATPYEGYAHLVAFQGEMWALGRESWHSTDGVRWQKVPSLPRGDDLFPIQAWVFDDRMWVADDIGVWSSADGATWTHESALPAGRRQGYSATVFDDHIYLMGGFSLEAAPTPEIWRPEYTSHNDVWRSADGVTWTRVLEHAPWSNRVYHGALVHEGNLYVVGGLRSADLVNMDDVWMSPDGERWYQIESPVSFTPRHGQTLYSIGDSIISAAGHNYGIRNDIWSLETAQQFSHVDFTAIERFEVIAGSGADVITTGDHSDIVHAGAGNDTIAAGAGNDVVAAGAGEDRIDGGARLYHIGGTMSFGDVDADGDTDVIESSGYTTNRFSAEAGSLFLDQLGRIGGYVGDRLADVTGDGLADLVQLHASGRIYVSASDGDGFDRYRLWGHGARGDDSLVDLNGDGRTDVAELHGNGFIYGWLSNGSGFNARTEWGWGVRPGDRFADVNGDGAADVVEPHQNGNIYVWLSGAASASPFAIWGNGSRPSDILGDVNGDGRDDLIEPNENGNIYVWTSNGSGFDPYRVWGRGARPSDRLADLSGDGKADLVETHENGNVYVWVSNGTGFSPYAIWASGVPSDSAFGDFNGDGKIDLLARDASGHASAWLSTGSSLVQVLQPDDDVLTGGPGADVFRFGTSSGHDVITDFEEVDFLDLRETSVASYSALLQAATDTPAGLSIAFDDTIVDLRGVTESSLHADGFLFA